MIRHPEVIVNIWQLMGISKVTMERTGPNTFDASDNAGSVGAVQFCYSSADTQLIFAEGSYEGPLFSRPIRARCLLLLKSAVRSRTKPSPAGDLPHGCVREH